MVFGAMSLTALGGFSFIYNSSFFSSFFGYSVYAFDRLIALFQGFSSFGRGLGCSI